MSKDSEINRREFIKTTARTGAGLAALGGISFFPNPQRIFGANDRVRIAVVGVHGQGWAHVHQYSQMPDVEIAAICDVDDNVTNQRLGEMEKMGIKKPATFVDLRKLLDDKSIDAISIATPNHWHSLQAIWGCQAGKDVYVEKPMCHNAWEGQQLVRAAQKYNRIVQHGTNSRSGPAIIEGVQKLNSGLIGDVYLSRGLCYKWRKSIGHAPEEAAPAGFNFDLWTGPAPMKPFTKNRYHYNWHWVWDTGNGDFGNQGIHELDVARWGLGVKYPNRVSAIGAHVMFQDDQTTPNVLTVAYQFDMPDGKKRLLEFEVRHWCTNHEAEIGTPAFGGGEVPAALGNAAEGKKKRGPEGTIGNIFYGSNGYLAMNGYDSYKSWVGEDLEPGPSAHAGGNNWANFIECVRSRKKQNLNAPIEEGLISTTLLHLGNASYRVGHALQFDPERLEIIDDREASLLFRDGDRGYRAPFVVPEEV
jgi:predicted dehydrogenase